MKTKQDIAAKTKTKPAKETRVSFRDRIRGLARLPASRLKASGRNFRTHDDKQRGVIRGLLAELGVVGAVLVWVPDDKARARLRAEKNFEAWLGKYTGPLELIDGHMRAEELRGQIVPMLVCDLDRVEAAKALATFDAVSDLAGQDAELLASLLGEIGSASESGTEALLEILRGEEKTKASDDLTEEPPDVPAVSVLGEVYELGPHRLVCGDAARPEVQEQALHGVQPRLWVCDPPFDLGYGAWPLLPSIDVVAVWHRSKDALVWMASTFAGDEWGTHTLVFTGGVRGQHNHTLPCCMHENLSLWRRKWWTDHQKAIDREVIAASGCKATADGRPISWQQGVGGVGAAVGEGMSWAKPTLETEIVLSYVPRGSVVWDPCAGSGSALIASAKHGRIWRGVEMNPQWADLIRRRWTKWARSNGVDPGRGSLEDV